MPNLRGGAIKRSCVDLAARLCTLPVEGFIRVTALPVNDLMLIVALLCALTKRDHDGLVRVVGVSAPGILVVTLALDWLRGVLLLLHRLPLVWSTWASFTDRVIRLFHKFVNRGVGKHVLRVLRHFLVAMARVLSGDIFVTSASTLTNLG